MAPSPFPYWATPEKYQNQGFRVYTKDPEIHAITNSYFARLQVIGSSTDLNLKGEVYDCSKVRKLHLNEARWMCRPPVPFDAPIGLDPGAVQAAGQPKIRLLFGPNLYQSVLALLLFEPFLRSFGLTQSQAPYD